MQIQCELLKQRQSEYLKARYEVRDKQRIHGKSLLTHYADPYLKIPFQTHSFFRLDDDDDEAAPVDAQCCCFEYPESAKYVHRSYPRIEFCIIHPCLYHFVASYPREAELKMKCCDAVFLFFRNIHYSEHAALELARKTRSLEKKVFFVQTKIDEVVFAEKRKRSFDHDESALLERIRTDTVRFLESGNLEGLLSNPKDLFLISSYSPDKWDFPRLEEAIVELHEQLDIRRLGDSFLGFHKANSISGTRTNVILIRVT